MSSSARLSQILDLCIEIDQGAIELYDNLSASAGSEALKSFWDKMAKDGRSQLDYWEGLKTLAAFDELPDAFDNPEQVVSELRERVENIHKLSKQWNKDKTVNGAFVTAYRLESYKLHPALRTLFQYYRPITDGTTADEGKELDETNINTVVDALDKYGEVTPELELVGETLQRLWDQNKALSEQAIIDPLSGLLNRRGFFMMAEQLAHLSKRTRMPIMVLVVEIDGFKAINALHGTKKGDQVIRLTGKILKSGLRQSDLIARYGGDEFIILLPDTTEEGGLAAAEKLREMVVDARPVDITVTVCIGLAENVMKGNVDMALAALIRSAERNLITAKDNGKNQIVY